MYTFNREEYNKRMEWYLDARFGMFIHWGLYSIPARGEWVRSEEEITKEEYMKFSEAVMDKPISFYAFEVLYWTGIREGELLALTPADFDFEKYTMTINKSFQHLNGRDLITTPKTEKSNRVIRIPKFLAEEMQEYLQMLYGLKKKDRIFTVTKNIVEVYI